MACSSLVRQPYYAPNRFILKISDLDAILATEKGRWAGRIFYMDEYTLIFLLSQCIRCAQKRYCWEPMLMVSDPCGSASTNRTFLPSIASPMPRFSQVVVLPVPFLVDDGNRGCFLGDKFHLAFVWKERHSIEKFTDDLLIMPVLYGNMKLQ